MTRVETVPASASRRASVAALVACATLAALGCAADGDSDLRSQPNDSGASEAAGGVGGSGDFGNAAETRAPAIAGEPRPRVPQRSCKVAADDEESFEPPECERMAPPDSFDPKLQWSAELGNGFGPPLVANFTDDNGDGEIDLCDTPDVIVIAGFEPPDVFAGTFLPTGGRIHVLDGATGEPHFVSAQTVQPSVTPAVGDIDGDGLPEIVATSWTLDQFLSGEMLTGLVAFDHEGQVQWAVPLDLENFADQRGTLGISLHDLDADGDVEVIVSTAVFDGATGELQWNAMDSALSLSTLALDLDGDGLLEVVTGLQAYDHAGDVVWDRMDLVQGNGLLADLINLVGVYPIAVNFDGDPQPEIVLAAGPGIFVLEHDGATKLGADGNPLTYRTGMQGLDLGEFNPPTAHDFDGDGVVDIALGAAAGFTVLDRDLQEIYQYSMTDQGLTATTAFDFLGDGQAEAVYADRDEVLFFDVARQEVVMSWPHSGQMDYPVVADVDNDDSAEVIIVSGGTVDTSQGFPVWVEKTAPTVQVLTDAEDRWIPTRRIWNMANYHVTNVREDGTVPAGGVPHYQQPNTFRTNVQFEAGGICIPAGPD